MLERAFSRAISNSESDWLDIQQSLGMSQYTFEQAKSIGKNDWLLIAISNATELDWRNYLSTWAIGYSETAANQVAAQGYAAVPGYFISVPKGAIARAKVSMESGCHWTAQHNGPATDDRTVLSHGVTRISRLIAPAFADASITGTAVVQDCHYKVTTIKRQR